MRFIEKDFSNYYYLFLEVITLKAPDLLSQWDKTYSSITFLNNTSEMLNQVTIYKH